MTLKELKAEIERIMPARGAAGEIRMRSARTIESVTEEILKRALWIEGNEGLRKIARAREVIIRWAKETNKKTAMRMMACYEGLAEEATTDGLASIIAYGNRMQDIEGVKRAIVIDSEVHGIKGVEDCSIAGRSKVIWAEGSYIKTRDLSRIEQVTECYMVMGESSVAGSIQRSRIHIYEKSEIGKISMCQAEARGLSKIESAELSRILTFNNSQILGAARCNIVAWGGRAIEALDGTVVQVIRKVNTEITARCGSTVLIEPGAEARNIRKEKGARIINKNK